MHKALIIGPMTFLDISFENAVRQTSIAAKTIQEIRLNDTDGINYCQVIEYITRTYIGNNL